jgi:ribosome-associated protein
MQSPLIRIRPGISIAATELEERFVRASGPGGQNVNKVASAVELRFDIPGSSLPGDVKARLIALAGKRVNQEGVLLIDSREHRTQAQNREAARDRLVVLIQAAAKRPTKRRPTKPSRAATEQRIDTKKKRSTVKARRSAVTDDQ